MTSLQNHLPQSSGNKNSLFKYILGEAVSVDMASFFVSAGKRDVNELQKSGYGNPHCKEN